jgi:mono/diheme cytochrome c family protein
MRIHITVKQIGLAGLAGLSAWLLAMLFSRAASAQTPQGPAVSFEKRCYSCHNIGSGDKKGPDLKGVTDRRTREWLREFTQSPAAMNRKGDQAAAELFKKFSPEVMPDQVISPEELDAILNLVQELTRKGEVYVPPGAKLARTIGPSDAPDGLLLFTGRWKFQNGGAACIACHNFKGAGAFGGGTLGPDLTTANVKYRDPELISILQNPNFPTMNSVFAARPLNDEEIVKIFALFQNAKQQNPNAQVAATAPIEARFPLIGAVTLILAIVGMNLIWRNRLRGVREEIVRRSRI